VTDNLTARSLIIWLLKVAVLGFVTTLLASVTGASILAFIGVVTQGPVLLPAIPTALFYSIFIGPVLAWPVTLLVLPIAWILRKFLRPEFPTTMIFVVIGAVSGALAVWAIGEIQGEIDILDLTMLAAGTGGGVVAGFLFGIAK
jgi:hypothetical protein